MDTTRYHIPGLLQTCTNINYTFSNGFNDADLIVDKFD